jgi:hypothetical protein
MRDDLAPVVHDRERLAVRVDEQQAERGREVAGRADDEGWTR